jgi:hypothetical protein
MRRSQRIGFALGMAVAAFAALALASAGCGGKPHGTDSHAAPQTTAPAPPTPDTTPIEALRTPAGLVLKIEPPAPPPPVAPTPSPSH